MDTQLKIMTVPFPEPSVTIANSSSVRAGAGRPGAMLYGAGFTSLPAYTSVCISFWPRGANVPVQIREGMPILLAWGNWAGSS